MIKKIFMFLLLLVFLTSCDIVEITYLEEDTENITVHFIDVGQADATFIKSSKGNILIDAGENATSDKLVDYIKSLNVEKIDMVVGTHPHTDHIGGLSKIINNFEVDKIYLPNKTTTTKTFENLLTSIKNKGLKITTPKLGEKIIVGDLSFTVLNPINTDYDNLNNYSIVLKMIYKDISFLFTGDAEKEVEKDILKNEFDIKADVYKVSHHGSSTSTTENFLTKIDPKIGVISCGKNNDYGHPHKEVVALLNKYNVLSYDTSKEGTIILETDGYNIKYDGKIIFEEKEKINELEKQYSDISGNGLIKGNINSKGEKIYHMPGGAYYEKTNPNKTFKTEKEAIDDGFRKSSR